MKQALILVCGEVPHVRWLMPWRPPEGEATWQAQQLKDQVGLSWGRGRGLSHGCVAADEVSAAAAAAAAEAGASGGSYSYAVLLLEAALTFLLPVAMALGAMWATGESGLPGKPGDDLKLHALAR